VVKHGVESNLPIMFSEEKKLLAEMTQRHRDMEYFDSWKKVFTEISVLSYMYAKSGNTADSHEIFSKMLCTKLVSWTSMVNGHWSHGYGGKGVELFHCMIRY